MITLTQIQEAGERIAPHIIKTPLLRLPTLDDYLHCEVYVKLECMQRTGSFKLRGALNKMLSLQPDQLKNGVVAASSGNHGRAVAFGAKMLHTEATIVMPRTSPQVKINAIRDLGAKVVLCDVKDRFAIAEQICKEKNATILPPYNDELIMAGQGTVGLEILSQAPELDAVVIPVSGGGLLGGTATALKLGGKAQRQAGDTQLGSDAHMAGAYSYGAWQADDSIHEDKASQVQDASSRSTAQQTQEIKVYGAEPEAVPRYSRSLEAGHPVRVERHSSAADALVSDMPGSICFPQVAKYTDDVFTVSDEYTLQGMRLLLTEGKILAEPSSCIGIGAMLQGVVPVGGKVCFLISGGNVGLEQLK